MIPALSTDYQLVCNPLVTRGSLGSQKPVLNRMGVRVPPWAPVFAVAQRKRRLPRRSAAETGAYLAGVQSYDWASQSSEREDGRSPACKATTWHAPSSLQRSGSEDCRVEVRLRGQKCFFASARPDDVFR
jgi:hypothetical protein